MTSVLEDLPLVRAKLGGVGGVGEACGPGVGPGSYDVCGGATACARLRAPFDTTSVRPPLSTCDAAVPGPGAYRTPANVVARDTRSHTRRGKASCPFDSTVPRFAAAHDDTPGPGAYDATAAAAAAPRVHAFATQPRSAATHVATCGDSGARMQPLHVPPHVTAATRRVPRAAHFAKYSGRDSGAPRGSDVPGPGAYRVPARAHESLYASKPTSVFASTVPRSRCFDATAGATCVPGPGAYDVDPSITRRGRRRIAATAGATLYDDVDAAAFGTRARRFAGADSATPGPGAYGVAATGMARAATAAVTAPFRSTSDRFARTCDVLPGPGTYAGAACGMYDRLARTLDARSGAAARAAAASGGGVSLWHCVRDDDNGNGDDARDVPARTLCLPRRTAALTGYANGTRGGEDGGGGGGAAREVAPLREHATVVSTAPHTATASPSVRGGAFSALPRMPHALRSSDEDVPGPGSYDAMAASGATRPQRYAHSTWSRDVRTTAAAGAAGGVGGPLPCDVPTSTLLRKTYNITVQDDTTWM